MCTKILNFFLRNPLKKKKKKKRNFLTATIWELGVAQTLRKLPPRGAVVAREDGGRIRVVGGSGRGLHNCSAVFHPGVAGRLASA